MKYSKSQYDKHMNENYSKLKKFIGSNYMYCKFTGNKISITVTTSRYLSEGEVVYIVNIYINNKRYTSLFRRHVEYILENFITISEHREIVINTL